MVFPLCLCKSCSQCKTKLLLFCFCSNKKKLKLLRLICFKMWRLVFWCKTKVESVVDANRRNEKNKQRLLLSQKNKNSCKSFLFKCLLFQNHDFDHCALIVPFFTFSNTLKLVFFLFVWKQEVFSCNQHVLFCCHFCFLSTERSNFKKKQKQGVLCLFLFETQF